jgi:hypothetical protein
MQLEKTRILLSDLISFYFFTSLCLSVLSKIIVRLENPFSETGCKDTHFFGTSKLFSHFFLIFAHYEQKNKT